MAPNRHTFNPLVLMKSKTTPSSVRLEMSLSLQRPSPLIGCGKEVGPSINIGVCPGCGLAQGKPLQSQGPTRTLHTRLDRP